MGRQREIVDLAVPAFLALVAEPLFLLADSAIIGHLGVAQLAGLGVASAALTTAAGVFVFLAYGTTSTVARRLGAGHPGRAASAGIDGLWLSLLLGIPTAGLLAVGAEPVCRALGADATVLPYAVSYLRVAAAGIPAMLVVLAVTGVLRGFQDTRTPLVVSVGGFTANVALNLWFVHGLNWGIAGSAWGTVLAQNAMAVVLTVALVRIARAQQAAVRFHPGGVLAAGLTGVPLLVRTLALRAVLLVTTWLAAGFGAVPLAAHQVALTVWSFLAFALDALAIAAQALTGKALGAGDTVAVRETTALMLRWGVLGGLVMGALVVAGHGWIASWFSPEMAVREALSAALIVVGLGQALAGYVFVLDGVLIGAGDGRWLAWAMVANLVAYLPVVAVVKTLGSGVSADAQTVAGGQAATVTTILWLGFTGFMAIRGLILGLRARTDAWMVIGVNDRPTRSAASGT